MPILDPNTVECFSRSADQTRRFGMRLGSLLKPGDLVGLSGDLGAGKTTLISGVAKGWGSPDPVTSPTFVLVNEYYRSDSSILFHMDAYRIGSIWEAEELDFARMLQKGPVLIEVNCRPMGCSQPAEYMDLIMGQHETDSTLDALLYPEAFAARQNQPYRLQRYGCMKILQIPEDMDAVDHPIWEVARQLRSTYKISANAPSSPVTYAKTRDLETAGGLVYMVHKYEHVLRSDLELLRKTEKYYFQFLLNDGKSRRWFLDGNMGKPDFPALMKEYNCMGAVLVAADEQLEIPGAQCVTAGNMENAHKGFDCVIIGFQHTLLELNESACLKLIFTAMDLVRQGGKVIIPKNTYRYLSYEREGAEDLMLIKGLTLEAPQPGKTEAVTGTNERQ